MKRVILTHTGPPISRPGGREQAVGEVAKLYDGEIYFGFEGLRAQVD